MEKKDIEELAKAMLPMAESMNAGKTEIKFDYDDKWEFFCGFKKKTKE